MGADRYRHLQEATSRAVLHGPGHTDPALRQAVAHGTPPEALRPLVEKIRRHAYKVTDEDLAALAGQYTQDQVFELVVAAVLGAAEDRLHAGLRALEDA